MSGWDDHNGVEEDEDSLPSSSPHDNVAPLGALRTADKERWRGRDDNLVGAANVKQEEERLSRALPTFGRRDMPAPTIILDAAGAPPLWPPAGTRPCPRAAAMMVTPRPRPPPPRTMEVGSSSTARMTKEQPPALIVQGFRFLSFQLFDEGLRATSTTAMALSLTLPWHCMYGGGGLFS